MMSEESATFSGSISKVGTRLSQWCHSPFSTRTSKSKSVVSPPSPSGNGMGPTWLAMSSQNFMRKERCASPAKDQHTENKKYFKMNFSTMSWASGKSSWFSSYSKTMLIPLRIREKRLVSARMVVKTMMCSNCPAICKSVIATPPGSNIGRKVSTQNALVFCSRSSSAPSDCPFAIFSLLSKSPNLILFNSCVHIISGSTTSSANQTMPQRETVARVAYFKVSTSNMILTFGGMASRSPLGSVSNLLSSNTEFKFSAHSGSTSPSNMIH
mmetsp:Transcript_125260/g.362413  ORF Transcript_125260/g.362413 Transcript_125260/m.362413 type:complete len:269 (-) Transcript_125260:5014-5820(-)